MTRKRWKAWWWQVTVSSPTGTAIFRPILPCSCRWEADATSPGSACSHPKRHWPCSRNTSSTTHRAFADSCTLPVIGTMARLNGSARSRRSPQASPSAGKSPSHETRLTRHGVDFIFGRKGTTMVQLRIFGTPVKVKGTVLIPIVALWGIVTWLGFSWHPERGFGQGVLIGFVTVLLLLPADFGHALAHIFSARYAGAPMDEILITAGMPRTLYWKNEVSPDVHRMRAMGGPIFNVVGLLLSGVIYAVARGNPIARELAAWSAVGHGFILLAALLPLPMVDGGTLVKWTLVARGRTETEANEMV